MTQDTAPIAPDPSEPIPQTPPPLGAVPPEPIPAAGAAPPPMGTAAPTLNYRAPDGGYAGPAPTPDEKNMGMLSHLLGLFSSFIGPLIIWMMKKDQSPWVEDQAKEALNFQIIALLATIACFLGFCIAPLLILAVQITRIVFSIIGTVKANSGVAYRYPLPFRLLK